jgi:hypothetical protein
VAGSSGHGNKHLNSIKGEESFASSLSISLSRRTLHHVVSMIR